MPYGIRTGINLDPIYEDAGNYTSGLAVTATLRVSPNGDNSDGSSWTRAYQTFQGALNAASLDENECTLILIGPHATHYNIDMAGDPTWSANVIIHGTKRLWTEVKNDHTSATSVMKLTGKAEVNEVCISLGTGNNGLIMTHNGWGVHDCQFAANSLTSAKVALHIDGATVEHGHLENTEIDGNVTYTTGLLLDNAGHNEILETEFMECKTGVQIIHADSDINVFIDIIFHGCALGIDIDAGNSQVFDKIVFEDCIRNVDDEVGGHHWVDIHGGFDIEVNPDNLVGTQVNTGTALTYGSDTELLSAISRDNPFRIVGTSFEPSTNEWYQVRFSDDSGSTFYDNIQFDGNKQQGASAPSGTEHIFNKGDRISASARDISGSDNVKIWLQVQEI